MLNLVEITYLDGTTDIVTLAEANYAKDHHLLAPPPVVDDQLTLEDVYGENYVDRYQRY